MQTFDTIVVGAGSMGLAAGYYLAKEGQSVLLLDAFNPPHDQGAHHGETRLIRFAYGEGLKYVPFVLRAKALWEELETEATREIFKRVGVLNFAPAGDPYMKNVLASAQQFHLPLEILTAEGANERWPGIHFPGNMDIYFEPTSGILMIENILHTYYELAVQHGATIRANERVTAIDAANGQVVVQTNKNATYTAKNCIVTVGAWAKTLLAQTGVTIPLRPIRKTFAWYEADEQLYAENKFPGFAYINGSEGFYGFPSIDGAGLKIGRHDLGMPINPDDAPIPFGEVEQDQEDLDRFLHTFMPQVGELKFGKTCMYDMTPDEDFIIDTHPNHENIVFATGFSGHGFKFASAVGEALKDIATTGKTKVDLTPFKLDRF
mgnify:CR=1 FL=1